MNKTIDIKELEERIEILENQNKEDMEKFQELQTKRSEARKNKEKSTEFVIEKRMDAQSKKIRKNNKEAEKLKYQISVGGRKLKSIIAVSKDLTNNGFTKAEYHTSGMVRGWGEWYGQFSVIEEDATKFQICWRNKNKGNNYEKLINHLKEKYGEDLKIDCSHNIYLMK